MLASYALDWVTKWYSRLASHDIQQHHSRADSTLSPPWARRATSTWAFKSTLCHHSACIVERCHFLCSSHLPYLAMFNANMPRLIFPCHFPSLDLVDIVSHLAIRAREKSPSTWGFHLSFSFLRHCISSGNKSQRGVPLNLRSSSITYDCTHSSVLETMYIDISSGWYLYAIFTMPQLALASEGCRSVLHGLPAWNTKPSS